MCKLKDGVVINTHGYGQGISNENIDNDIALFMLETGKATEKDFEILPKGYKKQKEEPKELNKKEEPKELNKQ